MAPAPRHRHPSTSNVPKVLASSLGVKVSKVLASRLGVKVSKVLRRLSLSPLFPVLSLAPVVAREKAAAGRPHTTLGCAWDSCLIGPKSTHFVSRLFQIFGFRLGWVGGPSTAECPFPGPYLSPLAAVAHEKATTASSPFLAASGERA